MDSLYHHILSLVYLFSLFFVQSFAQQNCRYAQCNVPTCQFPVSIPGRCCAVCPQQAGKRAPSEKCPRADITLPCGDTCRVDLDCPAHQKCCDHGCGKSCRDRVTISSGSCPYGFAKPSTDCQKLSGAQCPSGYYCKYSLAANQADCCPTREHQGYQPPCHNDVCSPVYCSQPYIPQGQCCPVCPPQASAPPQQQQQSADVCANVICPDIYCNKPVLPPGACCYICSDTTTAAALPRRPLNQRIQHQQQNVHQQQHHQIQPQQHQIQLQQHNQLQSRPSDYLQLQPAQSAPQGQIQLQPQSLAVPSPTPQLQQQPMVQPQPSPSYQPNMFDSLMCAFSFCDTVNCPGSFIPPGECCHVCPPDPCAGVMCSQVMCPNAYTPKGQCCLVCPPGICRQCLYLVSQNYEGIEHDELSNASKGAVTRELEQTTESNHMSGEIPEATDDINVTDEYEASIKQHSGESSQGTFSSQQSNWSDDTSEIQLHLTKVNMVMKSLNVSPIRSQLKSDIKAAKPSTMRYYKRKAEESVNNILEIIAPSQGKMLKKELLPAEDFNEDEASLINTLSKLYTNTFDNSLKSQILSVLSMKMTKRELQNFIPGLTLYRIDQARGIFNKTACHRLEIKERSKNHRHKMDSSKVDHAMAFFMDPAFMQLISYGTKEIRLDSGEHITIPEVIRTTCHSKMIELYFSYCEDTGFCPLSKATLFKILNSCEAKHRTNLHGLDNITADGIDAIDSILEITNNLKEDSLLSKDQYDEINRNITDAKSYLKCDFKLHLEKDSMCADHCLNWLLSDPSDSKFKAPCNHEHTLECDRCEILKSVQETLDKVITKVQNSEKQDEIKKKFEDAIAIIHGWKSHIIRTVNQDLFRVHILENLKERDSVLVMDWAMKFLPMRHREKQTDWFGQRGLHWHVSVLIYRDEDGELGHRTFTHVLESVKQDWFAVASLLEHIMNTVKKQLPHISYVYLRSDNAGCYHCGNLWLSIPRISENTGIRICQYSYSEAQAGKSYCDSKIAHMRTKMRSYVANGNNILSADDMKTAIDHGSERPCMHNGKSYNSGQTFPKDCNNCTCTNGNIYCTNNTCELPCNYNGVTYKSRVTISNTLCQTCTCGNGIIYCTEDMCTRTPAPRPAPSREVFTPPIRRRPETRAPPIYQPPARPKTRASPTYPRPTPPRTRAPPTYPPPTPPRKRDPCSGVVCKRTTCQVTYQPLGTCCPICLNKGECLYEGKMFKNGEVQSANCQKCTCMDGLMVCSNDCIQRVTVPPTIRTTTVYIPQPTTRGPPPAPPPRRKPAPTKKITTRRGPPPRPPPPMNPRSQRGQTYPQPPLLVQTYEEIQAASNQQRGRGSRSFRNDAGPQYNPVPPRTQRNPNRGPSGNLPVRAEVYEPRPRVEPSRRTPPQLQQLQYEQMLQGPMIEPQHSQPSQRSQQSHQSQGLTYKDIKDPLPTRIYPNTMAPRFNPQPSPRYPAPRKRTYPPVPVRLKPVTSSQVKNDPRADRCLNVQCPKPNCPNFDIPPGECCPICKPQTKLPKKPGKCPPVKRAGLCVEFCKTDHDCMGQQICCFNGCKTQCVNPLNPVVKR